MKQNKIVNFQYYEKFFIIALFSVYFFVASQIFIDYGFYIDEKFHRANGFYWLNYLSNFFGFNDLSEISEIKLKEIEGFTLPNIGNWNLYGIIFDVPAAYFEIILKINNPIDYYQMRHFLVFIFFFISSIFFYQILKNRFNNILVSVVGLTLFILTPRLFGDSFWNNKDIIFLSFYTISLFFYFKLIDNPSTKIVILLALFSAIGTTIRFAGIFLPITLIFFFIIDKISKRNEINFKTIIFYFFYFFIFLFFFWPNVWADPQGALFSSLNLEMSWKGNVNFLGKYYFSGNLPYYYLFFWIVISTPLIHLFFFTFGFYSYTKRLLLRFLTIEQNSIHNDLWRSRNESKDFLVFINLIFFMSVLSFLNINLYNSWRLGYFLYIFIIYFASFGIYLLIIKFKKNILQLSLIFLTLIFFLTYRIILYHPYQSLYFNALVPTYIKNNVDVDYTGLSSFHFLKELIKNEKSNKPIKIAANSWYPLWRMVDLLSEKEKSKIIILANDQKTQATYLYSNRIYDIDKRYYKKYDIPSNFEKIKEFKIDNTIIFDVYKRLD
jgi:hypothetical protein